MVLIPSVSTCQRAGAGSAMERSNVPLATEQRPNIKYSTGFGKGKSGSGDRNRLQINLAVVRAALERSSATSNATARLRYGPRDREGVKKVSAAIGGGKSDG